MNTHPQKLFDSIEIIKIGSKDDLKQKILKSQEGYRFLTAQEVIGQLDPETNKTNYSSHSRQIILTDTLVFFRAGRGTEERACGYSSKKGNLKKLLEEQDFPAQNAFQFSEEGLQSLLEQDIKDIMTLPTTAYFGDFKKYNLPFFIGEDAAKEDYAGKEEGVNMRLLFSLIEEERYNLRDNTNLILGGIVGVYHCSTCSEINVGIVGPFALKYYFDSSGCRCSLSLMQVKDEEVPEQKYYSTKIASETPAIVSPGNVIINSKGQLSPLNLEID